MKLFTQTEIEFLIPFTIGLFLGVGSISILLFIAINNGGC